MSDQNKKRREKYSLLKEKAENGVHFSKIKFGKKEIKIGEKIKEVLIQKKLKILTLKIHLIQWSVNYVWIKVKKKSCLPKIDMDLEVFIDIHIVKKNDWEFKTHKRAKNGGFCHFLTSQKKF